MKALLGIIIIILSLSFSTEQLQSDIKKDTTNLSPVSVSKDDLKEFQSEDYNYEEKANKPSFLDKILAWLQNLLRKFWEAIFGVGTASGFLYFVFKILPYLILAYLLYILIRFFIRHNGQNLLTKSKEGGQFEISDEARIIQEEDIEQLLKSAVADKKYRLAIRYYYLLSLKQLNEGQFIEWQPQKTNEDYIDELSPSKLSIQFQNITNIYDFIWYGAFEINFERFKQLEPIFKDLNENIKLS